MKIGKEMLEKIITEESVDDAVVMILELISKEPEPKYARRGDYCAVCGCTEFWNNDED